MKKFLKTISLFIALLVAFSIYGCQINVNNHSQTSTCTVTLVYNNGIENKIMTEEVGEPFPMPCDPEKENYIFTGWYESNKCLTKYDFSKDLSADLTLYAGYELDGASLTNSISRNQIKGTFKVINKSYSTNFFGQETKSSTGQGSAFCFYKDSSNNFYLLTNCHVAKKALDYDKQKLTVVDYKGNTYDASIYKSPEKPLSAIDADYDLACLVFNAPEIDYPVFPFANKSPLATDDVIALGTPQGQTNAITYGKVEKYQKVSISNTLKDYSNITFDVLTHNAFITNGSSGGVLLNSKLQVVGVNYAGKEDNDTSEYVCSYAIPLEKINEFLDAYVYS